MKEQRFDGNKLQLSDREWKERLTPEQYRVLRHHDTEPPFCNAFFDAKKKGTYICAGCGLALFSSDVKYDSGTGWPSYFRPVYEENVSYRTDHTLFPTRIEVICSCCEGHLGHVFDDGPEPTGKRYCINSVALRFIPRD